MAHRARPARARRDANGHPVTLGRLAGGERAEIARCLAVPGLFLAYSLFFVNKGLNTFDEGWMVLASERILNGEVPYRDFFLHTNPLSYYLLAGVFSLFGQTLLVARIAGAVVNAALALLI